MSILKRLNYSNRAGEVFLVTGTLLVCFVFFNFSSKIFNLQGIPIFETVGVLWFIIAITQVSYFLSVKDIQLLVLKLLTSFMLSVALYSLYFGSYYGYYYYLGTHRPFKLIARVNSVTKDNRGWTLNCRSHTFKKSMRLDGAMHSQMLKGGVENYCVHFDVFEGENKIIYWESYEIKPCE